ncbi:hypothetical protein R8871_06346 [Paraburkholderia graminis C4D1M]|nr:hypothetical protein R8871_06346 [Paraburkholderia graminis C4D1M]
MSLDELKQLRIVVGEIADAEQGNSRRYQIRRRATLDGRHAPASGNALLRRVGRAEVGRPEPVGDTRGHDGLEALPLGPPEQPAIVAALLIALLSSTTRRQSPGGEEGRTRPLPVKRCSSPCSAVMQNAPNTFSVVGEHRLPAGMAAAHPPVTATPGRCPIIETVGDEQSLPGLLAPLNPGQSVAAALLRRRPSCARC